MAGIDIAVVVFYLVVIVIIGIISGKGLKSLENFSVASRSFPAWVVFATLSASFIGGGFTLGNAEKVFSMGIVYVFALWGFSLKEILVSRYIAPRMSQFSNAISVGDIMAKDYGCIGKVLSGIFGVLLCAGVVGAQVGAMGYVFNLFLGISYFWGVIIGFGIVVFYSTIGGMRAVIYTDVLQFVILGIGLPLAFFLGWHEIGGLKAIKNAVPAGHFHMFGGMSFIAFASLFLTFLLGETLVPPYVQRLLINKDTREIEKGTLWSGLFSMPFMAIVGGIGLVAYTLDPTINANLAIPYVVREVLPVGFKGLVIAGIMGVVMSSADSFLNSASVAFTNDIIKPFKTLSDRAGLNIARFVTLMTGVLSAVFALSIKSILDILVYAYTFWSPVMLVPLVACVFGVKANYKSFLAGAIAGVVTWGLWQYQLGEPYGISSLIMAVFMNLVAFAIAHQLQKNKIGKSAQIA